MAQEEYLSYGWISRTGTVTFAPTVTGSADRCDSWAPLPVTFDGDRLTVILTCPQEAS